MKKTRKLVAVAAAAGVIAVGGTAFTAGNTMPSSEVVKGYGSQTISGVTAESITYNTNVPGDTIESVDLVLTGDTTDKTIQIAFNDAAPGTCSDLGDNSSGINTTYSCTVSQPVGGATKFALVAN